MIGRTDLNRRRDAWLMALALALVVVGAAPVAAQNAPGLIGKSVNLKAEDEYAPYLVLGSGSEDTLFFTSSRNIAGERRRARQSRIFFSTRPVTMRGGSITEGWRDAKLLSTVDASFRSFTQGATTVAGDRIIFAAERNLSNRGTSAQLDLWEMVREGAGYSKPAPISEVNDPDAWDSQPALSPDGKTLFFVSNRSGGKGHRDIWFSTLDGDGRWSRPQLLPNINTAGDEFSPFFGPDGKFYFSTDWDYEAARVGDRKKEIHRADVSWANGEPTPTNPRNLDDAIREDAQRLDIKLPDDLKINSPEDDEFPYITPDRKAIFLSSGRSGGFGGQDIYAFALPAPSIRLQVHVIEQLVDSSGAELSERREVNYPITVADSVSGSRINPVGDRTWGLEPQKTYSVALTGISPDDCFDVQVYNTPTIQVRSALPFGPDTLITREFLVTRRRISVPQVVFQATETLPFFITGYWWPNTVENLRKFDERKETDFFENSGFIQRDDYDYDAVSKTISKLFEDELYGPLERILPRFTARCADTLALVVTVHGYTDPRRLRPPHTYPDETVTVGVDEHGLPVTIEKGSDMTRDSWQADPNNSNSGTIQLPDNGQQGNILLSKLRARYTFETFDAQMKARSPIYAQLARDGRIILDAEGFGKYRDDGPDDDPQSRRIEVYLDGVPLSQVSTFKRERGGEVRGAKEMAEKRKKRERERADSLRREEQKHVADSLVAIKEHQGQSDSPSDAQQKSSCFSIQYCSIDDETLARQRVETLSERGVDSARIEEYKDRLGATLYRVRSGCYATAEQASDALSRLDWTTQALGLTSRPVIVR